MFVYFNILYTFLFLAQYIVLFTILILTFYILWSTILIRSFVILIEKAGDDMSVKVKTTFNTKKMMSDIKTQAKASLEKKSFDIECPHCKKSFSAHKGHNVCPYCNNAVTLNLNINF